MKGRTPCVSPTPATAGVAKRAAAAPRPRRVAVASFMPTTVPRYVTSSTFGFGEVEPRRRAVARGDDGRRHQPDDQREGDEADEREPAAGVGGYEKSAEAVEEGEPGVGVRLERLERVHEGDDEQREGAAHRRTDARAPRELALAERLPGVRRL